MRAYFNGSFYTVSFNERDAYTFRRNWPCSTVEGSGSFEYETDSGDLVGASGAAECGDGSDWLAFSEDCQRYGVKALAKRKILVNGRDSRTITMEE